MKNYLFVILFCFAAYKGWDYLTKESVEPLYATPYVAVYGRNSCGWTKKMLKELKASDIPYEYHIVDKREVADLLHARMQQSGIGTRRYNLPVVDVNGRLSVRPDSGVIISQYQASL
ncbi:MAG: hypothetical protein B6D77_14330 [gamma proteobacterium symbiont of Ctena orbiculata]|nr:MAG: hypothetical protein B6D77_14330 [gamma proteobacterium symbiont of Ctena orbiculata]PVV18025.1 MAG: hypothetical protein B6D78_17320 [gamma proteobacterium symbiont of Ctena orbiculata]